MRPTAKPNLAANADRSHNEGDDCEHGDYGVVGPVDHTRKERRVETQARCAARHACDGRDDRQRAYQYRFESQRCLGRIVR